jgi:DNA (cytosine-5)-methyltransferase 1
VLDGWWGGLFPSSPHHPLRKGNELITAVSLFAGVGGFDLAMQRAGIDVVAAVEIDKHAQKVLQRHFPMTAIHSDISEVTGEQLRADGFDPSNGIITGGFPCQDLSTAGARRGLAGERSGLFWQIIRLADELRPKWLILENVPGLLSSNRGADMGIVVGALERRGYGVAWRVLDAQYFGVAQRRRRLFFVCCLADHRRPVEILFEPESGIRNPTPRRKTGQDPARSPEASTYRKARRAQSVTDDETWVADDKTNTLNTFDLGDVRTTATILDNAFMRRLTPKECERLQGFPDDWTAGQTDGHRYKQMGNAVAVPVVEWIVRRLVK